MFCGHRMVPGWHQSTPRPPRGRRDSGSVFRMLMGKASSPKLKARRHKRDSARGKVVRWKATQSHMNATYKPPSSHVVGRGLRPSSYPQATLKRHQSTDKATCDSGSSIAKADRRLAEVVISAVGSGVVRLRFSPAPPQAQTRRRKRN